MKTNSRKWMVLTALLALTLSLATGCRKQTDDQLTVTDLPAETEGKATTATTAPATEDQKPPIIANVLNTAEEWAPQAKYLVLEGWAPVTEGTEGNKIIWAVEEKASFRFWVDEPEKGGELVLIGWKPKEIAKQTITISVNGKPLAQTVTMDGRSTPYTLPVPADALTQGQNRFTLGFSEVKLIGDRNLAANFRLIALNPPKVAPVAAPPASSAKEKTAK
ncbi:MAG: hypothetical protein KA419_13650 [Acidobacteria bacterium]|nr:hypothetical protein [Acidobacteriota bacterium]